MHGPAFCNTEVCHLLRLESILNFLCLFDKRKIKTLRLVYDRRRSGRDIDETTREMPLEEEEEEHKFCSLHGSERESASAR